MFTTDRFIDACLAARQEGPAAVREVVKAAVSEPASIIAALGEPARAGIVPLYRAPDLTIINFAWAPYMSLMPHNHQMFAIIGIYHGREDNVFWRRNETSIEAAGARSLGVGDVATLGRDTIHSVLNPIGKMTTAIHVYGGDFFDPAAQRSEWDHETLREGPWDIAKVRSLFEAAEARFNRATAGDIAATHPPRQDA
jgi:predicted metal-dependent enzyme (double-stranded beta helix superfamily)